jgi:endonuclease YncB( thermonuclease family)
MHTIKRLFLYLIAVIALLFSFGDNSFAAQYKCTLVTDGDTITVTQNGFKKTIRLVGIDAPEKSRKKNDPGQPFSQNSSKFFAGMVLNMNVDVISYGTDRY